MFIMRKRVALTISLFHVAGKVFIHLPLLVLQPLWTFLCLMLFWVYWITVLLFLGTSGEDKSSCSCASFIWMFVTFITASQFKRLLSAYRCFRMVFIVRAVHRLVSGFRCVGGTVLKQVEY